MMFRPKTPMRLTACSGKTRKSDDGAQLRVVVLAFQLQPFTAEMANDLNVKARLFSIGDGLPLPDVASANLKIAVPPQRLTLHEAPDDDMPASVVLEDVEIAPILAVRADKQGPVYSAIVRAEFAYPTPKDLLWLFHKVTEQTFATFEATGQQTLIPDEDDCDAGDDDERLLRDIHRTAMGDRPPQGT